MWLTHEVKVKFSLYNPFLCLNFNLSASQITRYFEFGLHIFFSEHQYFK